MDEVTNDPMIHRLKDALTNTAYACSSFDRLSGGTANFTYRGYLEIPEDGISSIVIKHSEPYIARVPSWPLDISRCQYEVIMLDALKSFEPTIYEDIRIRTPTVKPLASLSNTSILEDFKGSTDLKTYLGSHKSSLDFAFGRSLGFALGRWLSAFHQWANDPNNADATSLRGQLAGNLPMKQLKTDINIGRLVQSFPEFPGLPWESTEVYRKIEEDVRQMLWDQGDQLVHGDFWTGNILLENKLLTRGITSDVFVIDFELSHLGHPSQDLGQCLAELYCLYHFKGSFPSMQIIKGFCDGYTSGKTTDQDDTLGCQVAIHFGIHLVVWTWKTGWGTKDDEKMKQCIEFGNDCIVKGWRRDRDWFRDNCLDGLFPS